MNKNSKKILYVVIFLLVLSLISIIASNKDNLNNSESLNILSSYDNADLEDNIKNYVKKNNRFNQRRSEKSCERILSNDRGRSI